jgi:hypothetical protein
LSAEQADKCLRVIPVQKTRMDVPDGLSVIAAPAFDVDASFPAPSLNLIGLSTEASHGDGHFYEVREVPLNRFKRRPSFVPAHRTALSLTMPGGRSGGTLAGRSGMKIPQPFCPKAPGFRQGQSRVIRSQTASSVASQPCLWASRASLDWPERLQTLQRNLTTTKG